MSNENLQIKLTKLIAKSRDYYDKQQKLEKQFEELTTEFHYDDFWNATFELSDIQTIVDEILQGKKKGRKRRQ